VPSYTTVCPSPSAPTETVIESSTYSITDATTITVGPKPSAPVEVHPTAPAAPPAYTTVIPAPPQPTTTIIDSVTYSYESETTIEVKPTAPVESSPEAPVEQPSAPGYTITVPVSEIPAYVPTAGPEAPAAPAAPAPSSYVPAGNGSDVSPVPGQVGNGAGKLMAGSAAFAAVLAAALLL